MCTIAFMGALKGSLTLFRHELWELVRNVRGKEVNSTWEPLIEAPDAAANMSSDG